MRRCGRSPSTRGHLDASLRSLFMLGLEGLQRPQEGFNAEALLG
jgi:hypothetical protein